MPDKILRAAILNPRPDGSVDWIRDGVIHADFTGRIAFIGEWTELSACLGPGANVHQARGIILPPFLDNHIHIPQHPIRGHFMKDVGPNPPEGRLLAGLNTNVFPTEAKCHDREYTERVVRQFLDDTLSNGVVGGAAYMTVHAAATELALEILPPTWHVGLVLMNQQPPYLRTDEANLERDVRRLAERFGPRFILTDRFAIAVDSPLRQRASKLAKELGLRMQTHLNEQRAEKERVEKVLYPDASSYTDVYRRDGLLDRSPILAHCIQMRDEEWSMVRDAGAVIAHCPTSNTLLGSGVMNLDEVHSRGIDYAICTDVGASPTTSLLAEVAQFLKIHRGRSSHATPSEALYRVTLGPARILGLNNLGTFELGKPLSYVELDCSAQEMDADDPDEGIVSALLESTTAQLDALTADPDCRRSLDALQQAGLDVGPELDCLCNEVDKTRRKLERKAQRVVMNGATVWERH
jgi:guanine deaminase